MDKMEKTTHIHIRCTRDLKEQLAKIAEEQERTLSGQVVYFLKKSIKQHQGSGSG
ncbi:ribbon-helix-helix domain-containing protein [Desulfoluna spongiiphila]|uniref:CopG-like RHH_1 or ribbon-helix-helix domain-containing protein, RHH_5 n=1 Tax=Desulfoluna spongiiphila TaxID=419481 RepID=A0A1G5J7P9_9BACT|nr:hypothetical protein [Desulfoluna spongiiphila]SCY84385.1 CopG-like RHH_1 or ribbon-helix-helix domain-containing protein, RHH_5 [Desulfoluna spongiiphila]